MAEQEMVELKGTVEQVLYEDASSGFAVVEIDGNDFDQLEAAFTLARGTKGVPFAIVMKTVKGKGVSYMENNAGWHGKAPNDEEYETAMKELRAQLAEVEAM